MSTANAPKTQLGRYQLVRHLASGVMTELWLGKGTDGANVALKRVRMEHARDRRYVQAFVDEVRVATTLRHANIATVHDVGVDGGEYFVAMEWVHGVDLRRLLAHAHAAGQQLPIEHVASIGLAATAALQHAHAHGTVHSDVAPASIVVGFDGVAKLIDFGVAQAAQRTRDTQPGAMKGKVAYMAPEQCVGQAVDARSDIYSLGVVLYELATARRLFKAPNDFLAMTAILHGVIPPPSTVRPGIAPELDAIIMTALARDPDHRFQSVADMRAALEELCTTKHIRTSPAILADHLREAFGKQAAPWIARAAPVDFDGVRPGVVAIPEVALPQAPMVTPGQLRAVAPLDPGDEATEIVAPLPLDLRLMRERRDAELAVGDATMLVRPAAKRGRRAGVIALLAVAAIAGAAVFLIAQSGGDDDDPRLRANPNIKLPPPSNPAPAVSPPLPDAAVEVVVVPDAAEVAAPPPPVVKQQPVVTKKRKKKTKRPVRRARKPPVEETAWDRESLFPK